MSEPMINELAERLGRMERENRRLKQAGGLAVGVVILLTAGGAYRAEEPKELRVQRLMITDKEGKIRAVLSEEDGPVILGFLDKEGKVRASLGIEPNGSVGLRVRDRSPQIALTSDPDETTSLAIYDKNAKRRIGLYVTPTCEAMLDVRDNHEVSRFRSGVDQDGTTSLNIYDENRKSRVGLYHRQSDSGLSVLDCTFRNFVHSAHEGRISSAPSTCWVR